MKEKHYTLLPNQATLPQQPRQVFTDPRQLAAFRENFHDTMRPMLDSLKKARQADTAAHLDEWANSPGLMPPK